MKTDELTVKERLARLAKKEPLDRVPVGAMPGLYAARLAQTSFKDYWTNPDRSLRALSLAADLHGYDEVPTYYYGWPDWLVNELGGEVCFPDNPYAFHKAAERPVINPEDAEQLCFPDPSCGPVSGPRLEHARRNVERGGKATVRINTTSFVCSLLGSAKLLRWYYTEPAAVHRLFRKVADYLMATIDVYVQEFGAKNCAFRESFPWDSQNIVSPDIFEKFGLVYTREIHARALAAGLDNWWLHLCGDHTRNLRFWQDLPIASRCTVSIGADMDIKGTAAFFGPAHIIYGNVPSELLQFGTPEEVTQRCREIIEAVKYHPGGFMLGPACDMPPAASPLNVQAMVKAAKTYGRYD